MWEAIRQNKRRSLWLITLMGVLLAVLGTVIGMSIDPQAGGPIGALAALFVCLILYLSAVSGGSSILLASAGARQIQKEDAPMLWNIVEEMTIASGMGKMPSVYIVDDPVPNAFAVGQKPESAAVAVTTGLLKRLNRDELQGVVAHEIGHIRNLDVKFMTLASVMVGAIVILSDMFLRSLRYGGMSRRRSSSSKGGDQAQAIFLLIALLMAILAPLAAQLLYFACSRKREYLADASAARYTRYPEGLASALEKISARSVEAKQINRAIAPLYIVNPLQGRSLASLFSTHPPTEKRIQILRGMAGADFTAYEQAYRQVWGESSRCLDPKTLAEADQTALRAPNPEQPDKKTESIQRIKQVNDLLSGIIGFIIIPCSCGVRIKVPPEYRRNQIKCPSCGRLHQVPS